MLLLFKLLSFFVDSALRHGFTYFDRLGGMQFIERHTFELTQSLVTAMTQLVHQGNITGTEQQPQEEVEGIPLCTIYGRHFDAAVSSKTQGIYMF